MSTTDPSAAEIEASASRCWPAMRALSIEGWELRLSRGATHRANSVRTSQFTGTDPTAAITAVESRYRRAGLPPCFQLSAQSRPRNLDALLAARGYRTVTPSWVMTAPAPAGLVVPEGIELLRRPTPDLLAAIGARDWSPEERVERLHILEAEGLDAWLALARQNDLPVACGRVVLDGDLAYLAAMRTRPGWRRRGHGRRVLEALLATAAAAGCRLVHLQVEQNNPRALTLYRRHGFETAFAYHYRELPAS